MKGRGIMEPTKGRIDERKVIDAELKKEG